MYYLPDCVTIFKKKGSKITSHSQYTDYEKLLNEYLLNLMNQTLSTTSPEFSGSAASATPLHLQTLSTPLSTPEFVGEVESETEPIRETLESKMEEFEQTLASFTPAFLASLTPAFRASPSSTPPLLQTLKMKEFNKFIDDLPFTMKKVQEKVNERRQFYRLLLNDSPYSFYFTEVIEKILKDCGEYREQYTWNDIFSINFILKIEGDARV